MNADRVYVGVAHTKMLLYAAFCGLLAAIGLSRSISSSNTESALIVLFVCGLPCLFFAQAALRRRPVLVMDRETIENLRTGQAVRWTDVVDVFARQRQGTFGEHHELVFELDEPAPTVEFSIDDLSVGWEQVVALVEDHLGRPVPIRRP